MRWVGANGVVKFRSSKILVEILHPAHVHFFRPAIRYWVDRGDRVKVLARKKDCVTTLLSTLATRDIQVTSVAQSRGIGLALEAGVRMVHLRRICRDWQPDLLVGIMGATITPVGKILRIPTLVAYDTEAARFSNRLSYSLADRVLVPQCYEGWTPSTALRYPGYHELAYLNKNEFRISPTKISNAPDFFLVRWVGHGAVHDSNARWLTVDEKISAIKRLAENGKVFISSEDALPKELSRYQVKTDPKEFHQLLSRARGVWGESATVSSEAAILGVPAAFVSSESRGYINDIERRYGIVKWFRPEKWQDSLEWIIKTHKSKTKQARLLRERKSPIPVLLKVADEMMARAGAIT